MARTEFTSGMTAPNVRAALNANSALSDAHEAATTNPHGAHLYQDYLTVYSGVTLPDNQVVDSVRVYGESSGGQDAVVLREGRRVSLTQDGDEITVAYDLPAETQVVRIDPPFAWPRMDSESGAYYQSDYGLIDTEYDGTRLYEEWSSSDAVQHDAFAVIPFRIPTDFSAWIASDAFLLAYWTTATGGDATVSVSVKRSGAEIASSVDQATAGVWSTISLDATDLGSWTPGQVMLVEITLQATNTTLARVGELLLSYQVV